MYIDLEQDFRINLEVAAYASIAWSKMIKTIGMHVDPFGQWEVELERADPGSQKIRSIIRRVTGGDVPGLLRTAIVSAAMFVLYNAGSWTVGEALDYITGPDAPPEAQELSDDDARKIAEEVVKLLEAGVGRPEARRVYDELEKDSHVTGVGVTSSTTRRPSVIVPRSSFPNKTPEVIEEQIVKRTETREVELTLLRAFLTGEPTRKWGFLSSYGRFGAVIQDQAFLAFLAALTAGRLNVPMAQGIRMLVQLEVTEERVKGLWQPIERIVKRVIRVIPPPVQQNLGLEGPQQDQPEYDDRDGSEDRGPETNRSDQGQQ